MLKSFRSRSRIFASSKKAPFKWGLFWIHLLFTTRVNQHQNYTWLEVHLRGIIPYSLFCVQLLSLNICCVHQLDLFLFTAGFILLCGKLYTIVCPFSIDWYLDYFQFLTVVNKVLRHKLVNGIIHIFQMLFDFCLFDLSITKKRFIKISYLTDKW